MNAGRHWGRTERSPDTRGLSAPSQSSVALPQGRLLPSRDGQKHEALGELVCAEVGAGSTRTRIAVDVRCHARFHVGVDGG